MLNNAKVKMVKLVTLVRLQREGSSEAIKKAAATYMDCIIWDAIHGVKIDEDEVVRTIAIVSEKIKDVEFTNYMTEGITWSLVIQDHPEYQRAEIADKLEAALELVIKTLMSHKAA